MHFEPRERSWRVCRRGVGPVSTISNTTHSNPRRLWVWLALAGGIITVVVVIIGIVERALRFIIAY